MLGDEPDTGDWKKTYTPEDAKGLIFWGSFPQQFNFPLKYRPLQQYWRQMHMVSNNTENNTFN